MQFTDDEFCRKCGSGIEHHGYNTETDEWICPGSEPVKEQPCQHLDTAFTGPGLTMTCNDCGKVFS